MGVGAHTARTDQAREPTHSWERRIEAAQEGHGEQQARVWKDSILSELCFGLEVIVGRMAGTAGYMCSEVGAGGHHGACLQNSRCTSVSWRICRRPARATFNLIHDMTGGTLPISLATLRKMKTDRTHSIIDGQ